MGGPRKKEKEREKKRKREEKEKNCAADGAEIEMMHSVVWYGMVAVLYLV
jgi:hypothetical protein